MVSVVFAERWRKLETHQKFWMTSRKSFTYKVHSISSWIQSASLSHLCSTKSMCCDSNSSLNLTLADFWWILWITCMRPYHWSMVEWRICRATELATNCTFNWRRVLDEDNTRSEISHVSHEINNVFLHNENDCRCRSVCKLPTGGPCCCFCWIVFVIRVFAILRVCCLSSAFFPAQFSFSICIAQERTRNACWYSLYGPMHIGECRMKRCKHSLVRRTILNAWKMLQCMCAPLDCDLTNRKLRAASYGVAISSESIGRCGCSHTHRLDQRALFRKLSNNYKLNANTNF